MPGLALAPVGNAAREALYVIQCSPSVRLELDSRPESVTLVRGMLAGVGELLEFDAELLDDLKTAVSEACNNVVIHAYSGERGPMLVDLGVNTDGVEVMVRDHGEGIHHVGPSEDRMGVGLAVITALADRAEFVSPSDGGTEVRMSFAGQSTEIRPQACPEEVERAAGREDPPLTWDAVVTLAPVALLAGVLGRLARALAASARFSLDRFSDVFLVTDAIAAHAHTAASGAAIKFALVAQDRRLELMIGPFRAGTGAELQKDEPSGRSGSALALLVDEIAVEESDDSSERLRIALHDVRRALPGAADQL